MVVPACTIAMRSLFIDADPRSSQDLLASTIKSAQGCFTIKPMAGIFTWPKSTKDISTKWTNWKSGWKAMVWPMRVFSLEPGPWSLELILQKSRSWEMVARFQNRKTWKKIQKESIVWRLRQTNGPKAGQACQLARRGKKSSGPELTTAFEKLWVAIKTLGSRVVLYAVVQSSIAWNQIIASTRTWIRIKKNLMA